MEPLHISPEQVVKAHIDLNCKTSIAIHHRTFDSAMVGYDDPRKDLIKVLNKLKVS
jgi:hypothetical protein